MTTRTLEELRRLYPGRIGLLADEVALLLRGKTSRGVVQRVRVNMKSGRYPGAQKIDGRWQMSIEAIADLLSSNPMSAPVIPSDSVSVAKSRTGRRRSQIGPRLAFIRSLQFWSQVARGLGLMEVAQQMMSEAIELRDAGRLERDQKRANELQARFEGGTAPAQGTRPRHPLRP